MALSAQTLDPEKHPTVRTLRRLGQLETWANGNPAYPLLARIWLVPQQTSAGTLTIEDLIAGCASFTLAALGAGLREHDAVRHRLSHPTHGEGRIGFLSVEAITIPKNKIRRYATSQAANDGLSD